MAFKTRSAFRSFLLSSYFSLICLIYTHIDALQLSVDDWNSLNEIKHTFRIVWKRTKDLVTTQIKTNFQLKSLFKAHSLYLLFYRYEALYCG